MNETTRTLENLELVGGALCLDFVNTINSRLHTEHDYLLQYSDLVGWANKVGILSTVQTNQLLKRAKQPSKEADHALKTSRALRDLIYTILSKTAKGSEPNQEDLEFLLQMYAEAISHAVFLKEGNHYTTTWKADQSFDGMLWPVVHSAGELLLSGELGKVKECPGCGWLFLDTSKNQSRRWCSMNTCGARDKMRRYHKRQRSR